MLRSNPRGPACSKPSSRHLHPPVGPPSPTLHPARPLCSEQRAPGRWEMEPSSLSASLLGILGRQQKDSVQTTCPGSASSCCVMEEVQWGAFGVAQPLEGAGWECGAAYLPLQVGGDVSDLDLSAPAKTKPQVTVTGGQRLPEAFWEQDGETLRRHPASRAACCRSPAVPSITWRLSVEKPKRTSVEEAPGGERRFQPRVVPPRDMARAPPRGNSHPAPPQTACKTHSGSFGTKLTHCPSRAAFAILP